MTPGRGWRLGSGIRSTALLGLWIFVAACSGSGIGPFVTGPTDGRPEPSPPSEALCERAPLAPLAPRRPQGSPKPVPPDVQEIADQVADIRELDFLRPVPADPVTRRELDAVIQGSVDHDFPEVMARDRQRAWATIGVLPRGTDLRAAVQDLGRSQIIGLYDTSSDELLFLGDDTSSPLERLVLAHELTHALDDQRFDLGLADDLSNTCREERLAAYISLAEGDAQATSFQWAARHFTQADYADLNEEVAGFDQPSDVPPFLVSMLQFPYPNGQAFVEALIVQGGQDAVNAAFESPPLSTEQILHPDAYPDDRPRAADPPNLAAALGPEWEESDVLDVGESWLLTMLELRLGSGQAEMAAAGWDGGRYRAFEDSEDVAVVLDTVWDSDRDAEEFAGAMTEWLGSATASVAAEGDRVRVLFGSDRGTLETLEVAAG